MNDAVLYFLGQSQDIRRIFKSPDIFFPNDWIKLVFIIFSLSFFLFLFLYLKMSYTSVPLSFNGYETLQNPKKKSNKVHVSAACVNFPFPHFFFFA